MAHSGIRQTIVEPAQNFLDAAPEKPASTQPAAAQAAMPLPAARPDSAEFCLPTRRPPTPVLRILDDGGRSAEALRIRKSPFLIGRTVGDARILHDEMIADPHVEIVRLKRKLYVRNLTGKSNFFLRVTKAPLSVGQVVRIGNTRYQYGDPGELMPLEAGERAPCTHGQRWIPLNGDKVWIGRDAQSQGIVVKDPAVDLRHACLVREPSGQWLIVDNHSRNGTWLTAAEILVEGAVEFFLGEQAFRLEIPPRRQ